MCPAEHGLSWGIAFASQDICSTISYDTTQPWGSTPTPSS